MVYARSRFHAFSSLVALVLAVACSDDKSTAQTDTQVSADTAADATAVDSHSDAATGADAVVPGDPAGKAALLALPAAATVALKGLIAPAHLVETDGGVPHLYAENAHDLAMLHGFVVGRDRWFVLDMGRRLGLGRVAELLGEAGLDSDIESRQSAMSFVAERVLAAMTPAQQAHVDAFVAGLNAYRDEVIAGRLPPPSEMVLAAPLLGKKAAIDMMEPFTRRDIAGFSAVVIYQLGYETGDVGRGKTAAALDGYFVGQPEEKLRRDGAKADIWGYQAPVEPMISSSTGWGLETKDGPPTAPPPPPDASAGKGFGAGSGFGAGKAHGGQSAAARTELSMLTRLEARLNALQLRLGRDHDLGFGSNAWAVAGAATVDGRALLAGDGHLPLTIPSLFYQIGMDTAVLAGGDTHQMGLIIPGLPLMAVGTNGDLAWCQTQLFGDITDWYSEEIKLDAKGLPVTAHFQGKDRPLVAFDESIVVAEIKSPLFPSTGATVKFSRWTTFDGRWLADIEGDVVAEKHVAGPGQAVVRIGGKFVLPYDKNGDGHISAVSFDYTGLDEGNVLMAVDGFGHAADVDGFAEAAKGLVAYSQNLVAADKNGDIYYTGYQAVPCRNYLPRVSGGGWEKGADPSELLDGTKYGGFTVPIKDGVVDEDGAKGADGKVDPYRCVVPFDKYPAAKSPKRGYVVTANNDLGGASLDGRVDNDPYYIGGPWLAGLRAARIDERLKALADAKKADVATMATLQADVRSPVGQRFVSLLRGAIASAKGLAAKGSPAALQPHEARLVGLYQQLTPTADDVDARLATWAERGFLAESGVETFYHPAVTAEARADAVATAIFNRWFNRFAVLVLDDEPMPGIYRFSGSTGKIRAMDRFARGRGANNPLKLTSWNAATGESIFYDRIDTDVIERSDEVALMALIDALAFLRSPQKKPGSGGFGSDDLNTWLWGLRHQVRYESTIADFFTGDGLSAITDAFAIQTDKLPLLTGDAKKPGKFEKGDPRIGLTWFPRGGDAFVVDAAGGFWGGDDATYGSGPTFRMVIAVGDAKPYAEGGTGGRNVVPGGQSGLNDSPHFADQAALWLGNKALPMRLHWKDVVAGAERRVAFAPSP